MQSEAAERQADQRPQLQSASGLHFHVDRAVRTAAKIGSQNCEKRDQRSIAKQQKRSEAARIPNPQVKSNNCPPKAERQADIQTDRQTVLLCGSAFGFVLGFASGVSSASYPS